MSESARARPAPGLLKATGAGGAAIALSLCLFGSALAETGQDEDETTLIKKVEQNPASIPLNPDSPTLDPESLFNDFASNPKREPGPIDIQRTVFGLAMQGIPTFFRSPVALTPEDLKAGKADVAIMGASLDMSIGKCGTA